MTTNAPAAIAAAPLVAARRSRRYSCRRGKVHRTMERSLHSRRTNPASTVRGGWDSNRRSTYSPIPTRFGSGAFAHRQHYSRRALPRGARVQTAAATRAIAHSTRYLPGRGNHGAKSQSFRVSTASTASYAHSNPLRSRPTRPFVVLGQPAGAARRHALGATAGKRRVTERLLTARVVAQRLGLCTETVLAWVRDGKLPAFRLPGGAIRIDQEELEFWLQERATCRRPASNATPNTAHNGRLLSAPSTATRDEER